MGQGKGQNGYCRSAVHRDCCVTQWVVFHLNLLDVARGSSQDSRISHAGMGVRVILWLSRGSTSAVVMDSFLF